MLRKVLEKSLVLFPHAATHREALRRALEVAHGRLIVSASCFAFLFFAVILRLGNLGMLKEVPGSLARLAPSAAALHGRGNITDRHGLLLATTLTTNSLFADPRIILDAQEAATQLAGVLKNHKKQDLLEKLTAPRSFVWLARHLTPQQKQEIIRLGIPGIDFRLDEKRVYPYGPLTAHVVGFTDIDGVGLAGIEQSHDSLLRQDGGGVTLSIDVKIQHMLRDELSKAIIEFEADGAAGIIMDVRTGEVLALASLPDFDPNAPDLKSPEALFNQATLGVYEMGSTMKVVNTAMALDSGVVKLHSVFDASAPLKVGRFHISDYRGKNRPLTVEEIFKFSSNIGSAKMALAVGGGEQKKFMSKLGFLEKLSLEIPEVGMPQAPHKWSDVHTITASYGYGISITPMHLVRAIATLVNDGIMVHPTLRKPQAPLQEGNRIISSETSRQIRHLMRLAVTEGSVKKADVPGFHVSGKTGTSNLRKAKGRGYQKKYVRTNFIGVFPRQPQYAVWVMLDSPKGLSKTYGFNAAGWNSAPVAGRVIERMTSLLGIVPEVEAQESNRS